ncbi:hypothetical protein ACI48D_08745 [Massilia sp. LXY-6]|uniref:hypothetical protein n=1 Tax=Massilia sp. LXY-6 TaxID=3379823 RepID=UPI003EE3D1BE
MDTLKPVNVAGATIVVQVCLLTIIALAIFMEHESETVAQRSHKQQAYGLTLVLAILTIISVALSAEFYQVWSPLMGDVQLPTVSRSSAFMIVFLLDIFATMLLIRWTGGTRNSPFTSMLFLIPALAIFLREPPVKFIIYALIVGVYYYVTCSVRSNSPRPGFDYRDGSLQFHRVVNIGCLALAMLTGYITRPVPL